jgi:hypothetical protein
MREVNFSIPSANKASVGITTALYDRRALDTTATLPLINSLNNLAYLTTSSIRIRDILTVDGGVERLVSILKQGRNHKDMMELWKWNLAFQCIVNIGIRGSEGVRTRVIEADVVPVIATLLHNYISVMDKVKDKAEQNVKKSRYSRYRHEHHHHAGTTAGPERGRRQPPPPIEIPQGPSAIVGGEPEPRTGTVGENLLSLSSPPDRTTFPRRHQHQRSLQLNAPLRVPSLNDNGPSPTSITLAEALSMEPRDALRRPVRDIDRLPSMIPGLQAEFAQPESPTTPNGAPQLQHSIMRGSPRPIRRPTIRHQLSVSSQSDIMAGDASRPDVEMEIDPNVGLETELNMQDIDDEAMEGGGSPVRVEPPVGQDIEGVDTLDLASAATQQVPQASGMSPVPITDHTMPVPAPPPAQMHPYARFVHEATRTAMGTLPSMPSEGDILMCLQLLAYVSKYCNLRTYFQQSHLVPRLKMSEKELAVLDGVDPPTMEVDEDPDAMEEYLQPDDFNIFPLVEKFTVRHHASDMQYWAKVVMRNLCRKDDSRGGIRQCAYYQCGKWEKVTREFAKCRRCRRTKYCSKDCQKLAWVYHRHWCVEANQATGT